MKKSSLLSLSAVCVALLAFASPARAGVLTLTDGPTFTPPEAFTDNTIEADSVVDGGLIHITGNATVDANVASTASIDLSGTFSGDTNEKFSIAYLFTANSALTTDATFTISATLNGAPLPPTTGTISPGLHVYEGTIALPPFIVPETGTFTGSLSIDFSGAPAVVTEGTVDLAIQQFDFQLDASDATLDAPALPQNLSTRGNVGTGQDVLIGGFIITGNDDKLVVLRAIGPSLAPPDVNNPLADPTLELHDSTGAVVATNDNWMDNSADDRAVLTDNNLAPTNDAESALVRTLPPGKYTAIVRGVGESSGVALVEIYDLDNGTTDSKLANISTRGDIGVDQDVLIGGFIVGGGGGGFSSTIIRGLGPSLKNLGLTGFLADPVLELHDENGNAVDSNDNWMDNPNMQTIADDKLAPTDDKESALYEVLPPGHYTAVLMGSGGSTGVGLVEIYDIDQ